MALIALQFGHIGALEDFYENIDRTPHKDILAAYSTIMIQGVNVILAASEMTPGDKIRENG